MTDGWENLRQQYLAEPWGKLAQSAGFDPIHTESAARQAFRHCAKHMIRRDAPELVALVEALRAFRAFDELPTQAKRPDVFEFRVRQPLLRAIAAYEALK